MFEARWRGGARRRVRIHLASSSNPFARNRPRAKRRAMRTIIRHDERRSYELGHVRVRAPARRERGRAVHQLGAAAARGVPDRTAAVAAMSRLTKRQPPRERARVRPRRARSLTPCSLARSRRARWRRATRERRTAVSLGRRGRLLPMRARGQRITPASSDGVGALVVGAHTHDGDKVGAPFPDAAVALEEQHAVLRFVALGPERGVPAGGSDADGTNSFETRRGGDARRVESRTEARCLYPPRLDGDRRDETTTAAARERHDATDLTRRRPPQTENGTAPRT